MKERLKSDTIQTSYRKMLEDNQNIHEHHSLAQSRRYRVADIKCNKIKRYIVSTFFSNFIVQKQKCWK